MAIPRSQPLWRNVFGANRGQCHRQPEGLGVFGLAVELSLCTPPLRLAGLAPHRFVLG